MTWFSFLLAHGVRPFPARYFAHRIDRMYFDQGRPRQRAGIIRGDEDYYCPVPGVVYRSRLSDLVVLCDEQWKGAVIDRICSIFDMILVDEGQDFAGYDFNILLSLMNASERMIIVGDPRQQTYRTNAGLANSGFRDVFEFFAKNSSCQIDTTSLCTTHRCPADIICLANQLYPRLPEVLPSAGVSQGTITILTQKEFPSWAKSHDERLTVLRYSARSKTPAGYPTMNMGESKGLTLGNVAIFPTGDMRKWVKDHQIALKDETRAKLYVAITRTSRDLAFVL